MEHLFKQDRYRAVTVERRTGPITSPGCKQCSNLYKELVAITRRIGKLHHPMLPEIDTPRYRRENSPWQTQWNSEPDFMQNLSTEVIPSASRGTYRNDKDYSDLYAAIKKLKQELSARNIEIRQLRFMISRNKTRKDVWEQNEQSSKDTLPAAQVAVIYSDMYYTDWKLAFDSLREAGGEEKGTIFALLSILMKAYQYCSKKSNVQLDDILCGAILKEKVDKKGKPVLDDRNLQQMNDILQPTLLYRKHISETVISYLKQDFLSEELQQTSNVDGDDPVTKFIEKCVEVTWYMCLQDPQMDLDDSVTEFGVFDTSLHKYYSNKGELYNFIVWPILRLEKGGPLSTMGVAEATTKQLLSRRQTSISKTSKK